MYFNFVGIITPPFRQRYQAQINRLRENLLPLLRDKEHRDAFEALVDAWDREYAAMSNSEIPFIMDVMNLMANVDNMSKVMKLEKKLAELESRLLAIRDGMQALELTV